MTILACVLVVCLSALAGLHLVLRHREKLGAGRDEQLRAIQDEQKKAHERIARLEAKALR